MLIDSATYQATSRKRVKKILRYSAADPFVRDIMNASITYIPRWGLIQFLAKSQKKINKTCYGWTRKEGIDSYVLSPALSVTLHGQAPCRWVFCAGPH